MKRLKKEQYLQLKQFKKETNKDRAGKLIRDHSGHLYRVDENGSLRRCGRDDLIELSRSEPIPGIVRSGGDT